MQYNQCPVKTNTANLLRSPADACGRLSPRYSFRMENTTAGKADARFMAEAVALARNAAERGEGGPFGAVVVRGGEIVARGWNRVTGTNDPTAHAEVTAIREACRVLGRFHLEDCELYSSCEPCPMCLAAAHWARLKAVWYAATREDAASAGFDDAAMYAEAERPPERRTVPCRHLPEDAESAAAAMRGWAADPRKKPY